MACSVRRARRILGARSGIEDQRIDVDAGKDGRGGVSGDRQGRLGRASMAGSRSDSYLAGDDVPEDLAVPIRR